MVLGSLLQLQVTTRQFLDAIDSCREQRQLGPALALAYTLIDNLAYLGAPAIQLEVRDVDFIKWCDEYLTPRESLGCSAVDLYAARCGVLHSGSPHSRLARRGQAKKLGYAWGEATTASIAALLTPDAHLGTTIIHADTLFKILRAANDAFWNRCLLDPDLASRVLTRESTCFGSFNSY
jgi:hypothetical protein